MAQHGYYEHKEQVVKRLSRAEGQVRGLSRMVQDDAYCIDILTQITAVRSALDKVALELVRDHARHCLPDSAVQSPAGTDKVEELVAAMGRMLSR